MGLQESLDQPAVSLVRCAARNGVRPSDTLPAEDPGAVFGTDRTVDRGASIFRLPDRGTSSEVQ